MTLLGHWPHDASHTQPSKEWFVCVWCMVYGLCVSMVYGVYVYGLSLSLSLSLCGVWCVLCLCVHGVWFMFCA